jgi:hypothetical protein
MAPYLHSLTDIINIDIPAYRLRDLWLLIVTGKRLDSSVSVNMAVLLWIIIIDLY